MRNENIDIWKRKIDWIVERGGMVLLNTHPDYIDFDIKSSSEGYPVKYYQECLEYISKKYENLYWHVLPREMAYFWREK